MQLQVLQQEFAVCKVEDLSLVDMTDTFCFIGKTDAEISLVCDVRKVPSNTIEVDSGWKCLRIQGVLDFGLVGILAKIAMVLAEVEVPIFAVSTFNTDYVLTKTEHFQKAIVTLQQNGYEIV
ncbi:ACT domain-containing protein [Chakrabartyella piscis]|uniref:ACT domain-containing protein n=1 Tax=Chakrabartyella piscis TaxID=2918914 RepID=UPI00295843F7|nr:ACT domain-containing protein [Chakrabartyella piscis]